MTPSRINLKKITDSLRVASRKGDRAALTLALDQMKTLALSPRYSEKYLGLLQNPLARLVDLLVIKQGERIAHQKGWKAPGGGRRSPSARSAPPAPETSARGSRPRSNRPDRPRRAAPPPSSQPSLFD